MIVKADCRCYGGAEEEALSFPVPLSLQKVLGERLNRNQRGTKL
jgi:hypothetical protein